MAKQRAWPVSLGLVFLVAACTSDAEPPAATQGPPGERPAQSVLVAVAERGPFVQYTTFTGEVLADRHVELTAQESGVLQTLEVDEGDLVEEGQRIGQLDTDLQRRRVAEAETALATAQARVQQARADRRQLERDIERRRPTVERGAAPASELDALVDRTDVLESAIALAEAQVAEARQALASRRTELERRRVVAPFSGRVATRHLNAGAVVSSSTPILTLVDENTLEFVAQVSERRIASLRPDAAAEIRFDTSPDEVFTARLHRVGSIVDRQARTVELRFTVDAESITLRHGMFGRGRLAVAEVEDAVHIPQEALEEHEGQSRVWRVVDETVEPVDVEVLLESGRRRAVTQIEEGDRVITSPTTRLQRGARVRVVDPDAGSANARPGQP